MAGPTGWPAVVELFLAGKRGNTERCYRSDLAQFTQWCAAYELDPLQATRAHLGAYRAQLEDSGRASSTVARKLSAIAGAYKTALAEDVITRSPMTHVERPSVPDESQALGIDRQEVLDLLEAARADGPLARALITLLVLNGLRISEATTADVASLTRVQRHRVLRIRRKGTKDRDVALAPWTTTALDAYLDGRRSGPLLVSETRSGARLSRHAGGRLVARCAAAAGLPVGVTPHTLRHAYVTMCLDAGVSLQVVQDSADHADPRTTQRYNDARHRLDAAPTYTLVDYLAGRIGPGGADPQGTLF